MKEKVLVPSVGESVTSGILTGWIKQEGQSVEEGEDLFELETDKATVAVPAPADGRLHILVEAGQEVEIGQVVGELDPVDQEASDASPAREPPPPEPEAGPNGEPGTGGASGAGRVEAAAETLGLSPAVRRIVRERGLSEADLMGSGPRGRITKEDALRAAAEKEASAGAQDGGPEAGGGKEAAEAGRKAGGGKESADAVRQRAAGSGRQPTAAARTERQTRVPMSRLRRTVAERLVRARQETALLTTFNEINMETVIALRKRYGEQFEAKNKVRLGFMSFFVRASCQALQRFPAVNAMIEGEEIVYNNFYDIGVAVSTERGLLVPVLRDAEALSFAEIEKSILDLASRARDRKIAPDELAGGTFTITNGGVFGSLLSTPLPNYPQTAILGMHAIQNRPIAQEGQVVIKPMMYVALSYDHRLIDGREAVQFLVMVKNLIEDPQSLLLGV
jgi:2-oxoglutarate dehydrogenase E2 component (dihydrolipoamide succinyltransferase)